MRSKGFLLAPMAMTARAHRLHGACAIAVAVALIVLALPSPGYAAAPAAKAAHAAKAAPAASDPPPLYGDPRHPDISGMWDPFAGRGPVAAPPAATQGSAPPPGAAAMRNLMPEYTPEYQKKYDEQMRGFKEGHPEPDSVARCLAFGMPRFMGMPMEIIQTPGQITMNLMVLKDIRRVYLDGKHTDFADPSFNGDSIGRWEGDTLVVETNNIRAGQLSQGGGLYSDKLTAVERFRRISPTQLEHTMVLTDPEAFAKPLVVTKVFTLMPKGSRFEEYLCENQRD